MKQAEAKPLVIRYFRQWAAENGKPIPYTAAEGGFVFFGWLERNHPEALDFQCRGGKWQIVHIWLREARLVTQ